MKRKTSHRKLSASQWRWRKFRRRGVVFAMFLAGALLLGLADRAGLFGQRQDPDLPRYNEKLFTVVHVVDGDTLDINLPDGDKPATRIRLWGVDTPETVRPEHPVEHFGPQASAYTKREALHKAVRLELLPHRTRDKYNRLLAYVFLPDGTMLNRNLIVTGHGYADPRFDHPRKSEFLRLQTQARRQKQGLWADPHPNDWPDYISREK
ncbi:MAG: thermonuclease family protein [Phycisphaerae bacterium]|nr:thermonuclease family protein [Phycisphaerae bacterium]